MDDKQEPTPAAPEPAVGDAGRRALAVAYLDLWERHVASAAVHGSAPKPPRPDR